ncbi:MAG: LPS export ABC transporter ATP-binding protein [Gammaproteobacteria bacterium]|nr:LPS export ABC transporter ATP-binding protein [Gammaproteobacteria bacterium]
MSRLTARHLVKRYKKRTVVRDVSISVAAGEIVGLLGPNGAGKTTSFYMMVGLVPADGGRIELDGRDITDRPMHARARMGVGYLPQEASVFRKLSVADNIVAILELRTDLDRAGRARELERLLQELHVEHIRDSEGMALSGGERRRVEIARALAANPRFILLDEPFAGVDPIAVKDIHTIVLHLQQRGIGVLVTDHNVREMLKICARAYILNEGRVIAEGTPRQIEADETVRKVYLGEDFRL